MMHSNKPPVSGKIAPRPVELWRIWAIWLIVPTLCPALSAQDTGAGSGSVPAAPGSAAPDYGQLVSKPIAAALKLTAEQISAVAAVIKERDAALAAAKEPQKADLLLKANQRLAAVLNDDQRRLYRSLFSGRTLRFQFRFQKWADVLEWIAEEADLSLVLDAPPPGTFNYSDQRAYTPTQAIDLLNGWLLTKGYTLIRRDRLLMCVDLQEGIPPRAVPRIAVDALPARGTFELVTVLLPLDGHPQEDVTSEVQPLLGKYGEIKSLSKTKQVLITDTAGNLRDIVALIQKIPKPTPPKPKPKPPEPPKPVLQIYTTEKIEPDLAKTILGQLISGTILSEPGDRRLTVHATPAQQDIVKTVLAQMEANRPADKRPRLETYPLKSTDNTELLETLQLVAPEARFRVDSQLKQLLAWATPQQQSQVAETVEKLQQAVRPRERRQLEVYPLKKLDPETTLSLLQSLLPEANLTADATARNLIALAVLEDQQAIRNLLEQLQPQVAGAETPKLQAYPYQAADSGSITSLLETLAPQAKITDDQGGKRLLIVATAQDHAVVANVLEQVGNQPGADSDKLQTYPLSRSTQSSSVTDLLQSLIPDAQVVKDSEQNRLIVIGSAKDHQLVKQTIEQLAADKAGQPPQLKFYPLQKTEGSHAVTILQAIAPDARITLDTEHRRLSIVARDTDHQILAATLKRLEEATPAKEPNRLQLYTVTPEQRSRFQTIQSNLQAEIPGMRVIDGGQTDELVIWAPQSQHAVLLQILDQLKRDVPADQKPRLIAYPVRKVEPVSIQEALSNVLPNIRITVDQKASRLLVWARPSEHDTVRSAIEQLDTDAPVEAELKLMAYPVDQLDVSVVLDLLNSELPELNFVNDSTAQTIIVRAKLKQHGRIASLLENLRAATPPNRQRQLVAYPLPSGETTGLVDFFQAAFSGARVVVHPEQKRMTVWATREEQLRLQSLLEQLDGTAAGATAAQLKTYDLAGTSAGGLRSMLERVVPRARLVLDEDSRKLLVWAGPDEQKTVARIVAELELETDDTQGRSLELYTVRGLGSARQILESAVPKTRFLESSTDNTLAAWVLPAEHKQIQQVLERLRSSPEGDGQRALEMYTTGHLERSTARDVLQVAVPDVELFSGPDAATLMAWVRPEQHDRIQSVLAKLQASAGQQPGRTLQLYRVPKGTAGLFRSAVENMVPAVTLVDGPQPNLLMAWVQPAQHTQIEKALSQLNDNQAAIESRSLKIYELGQHADSELRSVLTAAVPQASIASGTHPGQWVVWALAAEHQTIRELTDGLKQAGNTPDSRLLQVYNITGVGSAAVREVLAPLLTDDVLVTGDDKSQRLFIRATAPQHQRIRGMIDQIKPALHRPTPRVTRVYAFPNPDAEAARSAISAIIPAARLATDSEQRRLVATGTEREQKIIAAVVQQMTEQGNQSLSPTPATYLIKQADASNVLAVLRRLYADREDVQLSLDETNRRLVAIATGSQHQTIRTLIEQLEDNIPPRPAMSTKFYPLEDVDGEAAKTLAQTILANQNSKGTVILEKRSNQLVITAVAQAHVLVAETLLQLQQTKRLLEVFQLDVVGVVNAQFALEGLFLSDDLGNDRAPSIQSDEDSQQLLVRGTAEQIDQIREALVKMGETQLVKTPGNTQGKPLRVIPFDGNLDTTLQRLQQIWPKIRKNPLRVIGPNSTLRRIDPVPQQPPAKDTPDKSECGAQEPPPKPGLAPEASTDSRPNPRSADDDQQAAPAPVVIVPGNNRLTIASDDIDALDQLEALLRSLSRSRRGNRGPDVAVYGLENSAADAVADTLNQLFGRNSPANNLVTGAIVVVPDRRLNALVVYANGKDRPQIERLIQSLDSNNIPATLATSQTRVMHLQSARATRVHNVLIGMYKAQIRSGGARNSISIPEGVSSEVADVLRQINAAASAPLLSIEVDEPTNALIIRAPRDLLEQVANLAGELDDAAGGEQARTISVIRLKKTRSKHVLDVLNNILD